MGQTEKESLLEFPCDFDIKVMGESDESFSESIIKIIKKHDVTFGSVMNMRCDIITPTYFRHLLLAFNNF